MWMTSYRLQIGVATLALGAVYLALATFASEPVSDACGAVYATSAVGVSFLLGMARFYR